MKALLIKITHMPAKIYMSIKWWPWNPWCVARLNLALKKYTESVMYEERVKAFGHDRADSVDIG